MPGYFFFFGAYELSRELLAEPGQKRDDIGLIKTMISGAAGGSVLWLVIFPADVVKSRIQVSTDYLNYFKFIQKLKFNSNL